MKTTLIRTLILLCLAAADWLPAQTAASSAAPAVPYQWLGPDAGIPVSAEGIVVKNVIGRDGKTYTSAAGAPGGKGMIPFVGNRQPIDNPGSKDIRIEIDPKTKETNYAGLVFATPCVLEILKDGTLLADKEGVAAKDAKGKAWISKQQMRDGKQVNAFIPAPASN